MSLKMKKRGKVVKAGNIAKRPIKAEAANGKAASNGHDREGLKFIRMKNSNPTTEAFVGRKKLDKPNPSLIPLEEVQKLLSYEGRPRSRMTIYGWRRHQGFPFYEVKREGRRPEIMFSKKLVTEWAKGRGVTLAP